MLPNPAIEFVLSFLELKKNWNSILELFKNLGLKFGL